MKKTIICIICAALSLQAISQNCNYVSLSTDVIEKASEQLRLKRSKPVNVNIPTLDMCMIGKDR